MTKLITTLGPLDATQLGLILPHEHIFVDLGPLGSTAWRSAEPAAVVQVMASEIERIKAQGVTALVECTPVGVGRRADIDLAVSLATHFPIVVPTGIYREPWIPQWAHDASEDELSEWLLQELTGQIEESGVQAAWIKLSVGDDGLTPCEIKLLRAAARAGRATGAVIGSHTIRGRVVHEQLDILEQAGYTAERFIWIHTQAEPDFDLHLAIARRGAWLEYDAIGSPYFADEFLIGRCQRLLDAGFAQRLLLSHDRGWYDPSQPGGGIPLPYTYLVESFLPKLLAAGIDQATVRQLTCTNPFQAFAR